MVHTKSPRPVFILLGLVVTGSYVASPVTAEEQSDVVHGNLILLVENGAWCWFQDERVLVDQRRGKLIIGSVAEDHGVGGSAREGDIDFTSYELDTGARQRVTLHPRLISYESGDDHNAPALWIRPDGNYLAMYAGHNNDHLSRYRITLRPGDGSQWTDEKTFDWKTNLPHETDFPVSYSNVAFLPSESRLFNFARGDNRSPNIMYSNDQGQNWRYAGKLTSTRNDIGYVNGYPKYCTNGRDQIHFLITEHHPRDFNNSVYHGFIQDGKSYRSDGTLVDPSIFDEEAPAPNEFTPVFRAGSLFGGVPMTRAWSIDVCVDTRGRPTALFSVRANDSTNDHRFLFARLEAGKWTVHELAKAGAGIYRRERDYLGLAALDPNHPHRVYISTPVNPRSGELMPHHEIFQGVTRDGGVRWDWIPITERSSVDNLRPVVPAWTENKTALLWFRGDYTWQHEYDTSIVGVIQRRAERHGRLQCVAADVRNTTLLSGAGIDAETTDAGWYWLEGSEGESLGLALSGEAAGPASDLETKVLFPAGGTYDVWGLFWSPIQDDWRLRAGLDSERTLVFRRKACQQVVAADLAGGAETDQFKLRLYKAYLGRVTAQANQSIGVFVGGGGSEGDGQHRTCYYGVAYSQVTRT